MLLVTASTVGTIVGLIIGVPIAVLIVFMVYTGKRCRNCGHMNQHWGYNICERCGRDRNG